MATPEQVEDGARALAEHWGMTWDRLDGLARGTLHGISRRVLDAAGPLSAPQPSSLTTGPDRAVHLVVDGLSALSPLGASPVSACGAERIERGTRDRRRVTCLPCERS